MISNDSLLMMCSADSKNDYSHLRPLGTTSLPQYTYVGGVDLGQATDPTAIAVLEKREQLVGRDPYSMNPVKCRCPASLEWQWLSEAWRSTTRTCAA